MFILQCVTVILKIKYELLENVISITGVYT